MAMKNYNYLEYWNERGKTPADVWPPEKSVYVSNVLGKLDFNTVLELGCGDGQLSKIIRFFDCELTGLDISPDRLESNKFLHGAINSNFIDFTSTALFDLVICSHFLLHIKPKDLDNVFKKMLWHAKKYIMIIEPAPNQNLGQWEYYNFEHDINKLTEKLNTEYYSIGDRIGLWLIRK